MPPRITKRPAVATEVRNVEKDQILSVDWRKGPTCNEVIVIVYEKMLHMDANNGEFEVAALNNRSDKTNFLASITDSNETMFIRAKNTTLKRPGLTNKIRQVDNAYCEDMVTIVEYAMLRLKQRAPMPKRAYEYSIKSTVPARRRAYNMLNDLALSCGLHPFTLGVLPESKGMFVLPPEHRIRLREVNIFNYLELPLEDRTNSRIVLGIENKWYSGEKEHRIPELVAFMDKLEKANGQPATIQAIIITEQRNLRMALQTLKITQHETMRRLMLVTSSRPLSRSSFFIL